MDKIVLDAIGEAIQKALAGAELRIRNLENNLALVKGNYEAAILELRRKNDEDILRLCGVVDALDAQLVEAKSVSERQETELISVRNLAIQLGITDIPNVRKAMQDTLAESQLALLLRVDEIEQDVEEQEKRIEQLEEKVGVTQAEVDALDQESDKRFTAMRDLVDLLSKRIGADVKAHPAYTDGEVVRAGSIRRFGFGGLFEAVVDTAKGARTAPDDWLMLSDGLYIEQNEYGVQLKSYSQGLLHTLAFPKDGEKGAEGQRGKQGVQGLRGNDGVGIDEIIVTENGMYVSLTNNKSHHFDFSPPLEKAIREVAPTIEQIAINAVVNGGNYVT